MFKLFGYQQELVDKARQSLAKGNHSVLLVSPAGSGKSVIIAEITRLAIEKGGHVMFMVHRKELVDQIIDTFLKDDIDLSHTTVMTVGKIKRRLGKLPTPTLIITDETHHSLAKTYQDIYNWYDNVPRLGFSATPWRLSGKGLKNVYDDMVEGPSVQWLIDNSYLADYTMYGYKSGDDSQLKKSSTGDYTGRSMDDYAKTIIRGDVIKTWREKANERKTIVYCHAVWFSKQVAQVFNNAGIKAAHVDSKTPSGERSKIMVDFKAGKIMVLCNCDLISEGFNVPDCSCVVLLRPTESLVLYIQQSMRPMRFVPGKHAVIIDQVGNFKKFGTPDTPRTWTLEDRKKKKGNGGGQLGPPVRTCEKCFAVIPAQSRSCPICGAEIEVTKTELDIDRDANLDDVTQFKPFSANYVVTKRPSDLKTRQDLEEYAKAKGYKPGWIYYQLKKRGLAH
ncbi:DEAD/DEAH box helicase [Limosilactobacillus fermentum]|uniref:Phage helicase n=1 Tax=Limosilactobacillus fermentum (strain NBRC 3956 / LMG 18251) TaxID=334390 RepID=A0ABF7R1E0_LIMF3|nr:DEAD/DEAH box helicase [Limosilactobacillus fermentum]ADJ40968.1 Phage helicase [Limosilactobacillus fermentum CECT 5716]BAG26800.1 phage helicase [Limosilactobacillus fermentum IFO 3956]GEA96440.1 DEAD/DEAH box helicase [Limosilactobacillus fermentum]